MVVLGYLSHEIRSGIAGLSCFVMTETIAVKSAGSDLRLCGLKSMLFLLTNCMTLSVESGLEPKSFEAGICVSSQDNLWNVRFL